MSKVKFATLVSLFAVASTAMAVVRSGQTADDTYFFEMSKVNGFHVGYDGRIRFLDTVDGSDFYGMQNNFVCAYDVGMSTSIYALLGVGTVKFKDDSVGGISDSGSGVSYGVGLWFNILDAEISTLFETIDRFRIQSALQYSRFNYKLDGDNGSWDEISGNITVGLVSSVVGTKTLWPQEVSLYVGPSFNAIWTTGDHRETKSSDMFGGIVGIDLLFDKAISFGGSAEFYPDGTAWTASAMIRF